MSPIRNINTFKTHKGYRCRTSWQYELFQIQFGQVYSSWKLFGSINLSNFPITSGHRHQTCKIESHISILKPFKSYCLN